VPPATVASDLAGFGEHARIAITPLVALLRRSDESLQIQVAETVRAIDKEIGVSQTLLTLIKLLDSHELSILRDALHELQEYGPAAVASVPKIDSMLQHPDDMTKIFACRALIKISPDDDLAIATSVLLKMLQPSTDATLRQSALFTAPEFGARVRAAFPFILDEALQVPNIHRLGDLKSQAEQAVKDIGAPIVPVLVLRLKNPDPIVRWQIVQLLSEMGEQASSAVQPLRVLKNDESMAVRKAAIKAIEKIRGGAQVP
jgi:HEAT repeat protein